MLKKSTIGLAGFFVMLCVSQTFAAMPSFVSKHVPKAALVGEGTYEWLMWDAYKATLYAPSGVFEKDQPHALVLHYLVSIDGKDIADKSIEIIKKQGLKDAAKLADWGAKLREIFPNVVDGTELTGLLDSKGSTIFYHDGKEIGRITDKEFAPRFFGIWLGDNTDDPKLTKQLLGQ